MEIMSILQNGTDMCINQSQIVSNGFTSANMMLALKDGTYEAVGPHFQNNPHHLAYDTLERHGTQIIHNLECSFSGIREYLRSHEIEGIVFWRGGEPQCKIKRSDFGFAWPVRPMTDQ